MKRVAISVHCSVLLPVEQMLDYLHQQQTPPHLSSMLLQAAGALTA